MSTWNFEGSLGAPENVADRAKPMEAPENLPYWDGLRAHRLVLPRCANCGLLSFPPVAGCSHCGFGNQEWEEISPEGSIYSFSVCFRPFGPGLETPYVPLIVELHCQKSLRVISNLVSVRLSEITFGMPVTGVFVGSNPTLLFFEPKSAHESNPTRIPEVSIRLTTPNYLSP